MKVEQFKEAIIDIGKHLAPDADWMPAFFLEKDRRLAIVGLLLMGESDESKDRTADMMEFLITVTNPDAVCFISTSWVGHGREDGSWVRPSKDPKRKEAVTGFCMGVRGEADGEALLIGYIQRSPDKPPVITNWVMHESEDDNEITTKGRFPEAMQAGFDNADPAGDLGRLETILAKMPGFFQKIDTGSEDERTKP